MEDYCIVFVTCPPSNAEKISRALLKKRLVACANIVSDMKSLYWWKGKMNTATESMLILKTRRRRLGKLEQEVKRLHPYEVPEIIAVPITYGSKEYLEWISKESTTKL